MGVQRPRVVRRARKTVVAAPRLGVRRRLAYNFVALVVAGLVLALTTPSSTSLPWLGLLVASSASALTWAYLFYVPHRLIAAAIALAVAAVLAWALTVVAWRAVPWAGIALTPYAVWLSVATSLAVGFARTP